MIFTFGTGGGADPKELYEALKYSGLVTPDMTKEQMLEVLANYFPEITMQLMKKSFSTSNSKNSITHNVTEDGTYFMYAIGQREYCGSQLLKNGSNVSSFTPKPYTYVHTRIAFVNAKVGDTLTVNAEPNTSNYPMTSIGILKVNAKITSNVQVLSSNGGAENTTRTISYTVQENANYMIFGANYRKADSITINHNGTEVPLKMSPNANGTYNEAFSIVNAKVGDTLYISSKGSESYGMVVLFLLKL